MIESEGLDILETSKADVRRRGWPWWLAAGLALVLVTVGFLPAV